MARTCQRCQHSNEDHAKFCLSCGAMLEVVAEESAADPLIGKVLMGRYRPTKLLGEGGMGRVYVAEQKMGAAVRKVAIKTLHPELSQDPQLVARFHRESETVIELSHPNTIQFYDFGELEDGTLFIVMEFIQGRSLASELEKGILDVQRIDKILVQICGSLHEAHGRGIIHRDLKPDNVLLTDRGGQTDFVKVLDFGIAKKGDAEDPQKQKLTKQGMVLGTPPYMSPEQFSGKGLDARSDIYSLGVMVYEMLTGHLPFDAKTPWEWATKHLTAQPTPFEAHSGHERIPAPKRAAVMKALSKDREQRQASVLEFLQEFTGYQDAQAAWTMATSSGGAIRPKASPAPQNLSLAQTALAPTGQQPAVGSGQYPPPTAPGHYGGMQPGPGSGQYPGPGGHVPSQPGVYAQHSPAPYNPGYGPGPGGPGVAPTAGFAQYPQAPVAQPSGGGRWIVLTVLLLFVLGGALGGLGIFFVAFPGSGPVATNEPQNGANNAGTVGTVGQPMQPMQPSTPTSTPSTPQTTQGSTTQGNPTQGNPTQGNTGQDNAGQGGAQQGGGQQGTAQQGTGQQGTGQQGTAQQGGAQQGGQGTTQEAGAQATDGDENEAGESGRGGDRGSRPRPRDRGPSAADEARARGLVAQGMGAVMRNDFRSAIALMREAQRLVGRRSPTTQQLQNELDRRGGNQCMALLQAGRCPQAQQLFRELSAVGATSGARYFGGWCPRP